MYLYQITILAKPNSFSTNFEEREITAQLYHPEQLTYARAKSWIMAELSNQLNSLTCILSLFYTCEYQPHLVVSNKEK